jgi:hypothetical protein
MNEGGQSILEAISTLEWFSTQNHEKVTIWQVEWAQIYYAPESPPPHIPHPPPTQLYHSFIHSFTIPSVVSYY